MTERYIVVAQLLGETEPAIFLCDEPDHDIARQKANELWENPSVEIVEIHREVRTRIARKSR